MINQSIKHLRQLWKSPEQEMRCTHHVTRATQVHMTATPLL